MEDRFKFRVWLPKCSKYNSKNGIYEFYSQMRKVHSVHLNKRRVIVTNTYGNCSVDINEYNILMQCTGLKDKNCKLIYEGDIVKLSGEEPYNNNQFRTDYDWTLIGKVQESDCMLEVLFKDCSSIFLYEYLNNDDIQEIEIIGNIYETPNLLEA